MNIDEFIATCESMKIAEEGIGLEFFHKAKNGKRYFTKKGRDRANERYGNAEKNRVLNNYTKPILEKLWKNNRVNEKIILGINNAQKRIRGIGKYDK